MTWHFTEVMTWQSVVRQATSDLLGAGWSGLEALQDVPHFSQRKVWESLKVPRQHVVARQEILQTRCLATA